MTEPGSKPTEEDWLQAEKDITDFMSQQHNLWWVLFVRKLLPSPGVGWTKERRGRFLVIFELTLNYILDYDIR